MHRRGEARTGSICLLPHPQTPRRANIQPICGYIVKKVGKVKEESTGGAGYQGQIRWSTIKGICDYSVTRSLPQHPRTRGSKLDS